MTQLGFKCNPSVVNSSAPPIPAAAQWASKYQPNVADASTKLINLSQGVPGSPPPAELLARLAEQAADPSTTTYGPIAGDAQLKQALADDLRKAYDAQVEVDNIAITAGCNLAFYSTMLALCQKGDEVILPTPWYFNHEMTLTQLGITIVPLPCLAPSFLPSVDTCASLITPKTRAIICVTPNNPTGAVYPPELIAQLSALAKKHSLPLVLDETYRDFLPAGRAHELFTQSDWSSSTVQLSSFSKSYAIPGHRLGSIVASPVFLKEVMKTLDCLQINPPRVAQKAVAWAIEGIRPWRESQRDALGERQTLFRELLACTGWEVMSGSAYFAMVKHPFEGATSELVASRLAEHCGVITLPGSFFGPALQMADDRYIRFSVANVANEELKLVPARLTKLNHIWGSLE